jgi:subtilisin family serine protease
MANNNEDDPIVALVSPKSRGGVSLFDMEESITPDNADEFGSDEDTIQNAVKALKDRGFDVQDVSEATLSIVGSKDLFQKVFSTGLRARSKALFEGAEDEMEFFDLEDDQEPDIPDDLSEFIEGVTPTVPPEFFGPESAVPPAIDPHSNAYQYLHVPNDVATVLKSARVHRNDTTGKGIKVAMPDSGFYEHDFYTTHGYRAQSTVLGPGASQPDQDNVGHGTGEAANIFANAPDVELIPIKMASDAVGAFNKARKQNPHVITNSWGWNTDHMSWKKIKNQYPSLHKTLKALETSISKAVSNGTVVCCSAGNGQYSFPGSHPDVISVGGVHVNYPDLDFEASSYASSFKSSMYSNRTCPDVCGLVGNEITIGNRSYAPSLMLPVQSGSQLDGIKPSTGSASDGWGLFSGTSAASPQVAGVVALLLEKKKSLTPKKVKKHLTDGAFDVTKGQTQMGHTAGQGTDLATGAGLVNAKWSWIITMGNLAGQFFEASEEERQEMMSNGEMPEFSADAFDDMVETLRSR